MVESVVTDRSLLAIRQQMFRLLGQLDQCGEHIAAAHLVAALDALDDRLDTPAADRADASPERPVDHFARVLIEHYGDRAEAVAREQLACSSGDAMLTWAAIVARMEALKA